MHFFRHSARDEAETSDYQDAEGSSESGSIDSDNQQFRMAEDAVMANLAGYLRRGRNLAPELDINLVRHKNTAFLHGQTHTVSVICKLASISRTWLSICCQQVTNKFTVSYFRLYEASILWGLRTRTICDSEDELIAKFFGRISRNLRWCKLVHPLADSNDSKAASSSDPQPSQ